MPPQVGFYSDPAKGWIEGVAILCAVLVVAVVTATNDYSKDEQFRALNAVKDDVTIQASPVQQRHIVFRRRKRCFTWRRVAEREKIERKKKMHLCCRAGVRGEGSGV